MTEKWVEKLVELAHKYPRCRYCFVGVMAVVYSMDCVADFWCEKIGGKQFKKAFISLICIMLMAALGTQRIEANQQNIIITAYEELSEAISVQEVVVGTSEEELNLPSTLKGKGYVEEIDVPQVEPVIEKEVSVPVTWVSEPLFNGDTVGTYVFKAVIDENYKGIEPLSITVHVIEAEEPVPNGIEEWINKVNGLTDSAVELAQMPQKDSEEFAEWEASMQVKVDLANELLNEYELFEESVKLEINEELINKLKDWQVVLDTHEEIPSVLNEIPPVSDNYVAISSDFTGGVLLSGNIYLDRDVTLTSSITINRSDTLNLNLNGHEIVYNGTPAINVYGTLNIYDFAVNVDNENTSSFNNDNEKQGTISGKSGIYNYGGIVKVFGGKIEGDNSESIYVLSGGEVYLSGSSTINGYDKDIVLSSENDKVYANDGDVDNPAFYEGETIVLDYNVYEYSTGIVSVYGVNDTNKDKFTFFDTNYCLETKENTNNLYLMGKPLSVTWYDAHGERLSGDNFPETLRYNDKMTIDVPDKEGFVSIGWLYSTDNINWSSDIWSSNSDLIKQDMYFKASYILGFNNGIGIESDPYQITSAEQLQSLATLVNSGIDKYNVSYYQLMNDIDLSTICSENKGSFVPIGFSYNRAFNGTFDGNNKTISNLYINQPEGDYQGLFGYVSSSGVIKNIHLKNVDITGYSNVGAICGRLNGGSILESAVSGQVKGYSDYGALYGVRNFGTLTNNTISDCEILAPINYIVDDNGIMAYEIYNISGKQVINIKAFYNGNWIKTTFENNDYKGYHVESDLQSGTVTPSARFINNGRYIQLNYTVTAGNEGIANGKIAVHADVMIGANDRAAIEVIQDEGDKVIGLRMVDGNQNNDSYGSQFNLYFADAGGVIPVDTYWFGYYRDRYQNSKYYEQLSEDNKSNDGDYEQRDGVYTKYSNGDSGLAFSWQNINLEANESRTYSVILGVGEKSDPPKWVEDSEHKSPIVLSLDTDKALLTLLVEAKVTHVENQIFNLYYNVDNSEETDLGAFTVGEIEDSISASLDISTLDDGEHTLNFWVVNSSGAASSVVKKVINIDSGKIINGLDILPPVSEKVEVKEDTPTVSVPPNELISSVVTKEEQEQEGITNINVTLTVEKKEEPQDKHIVENVVPSNQVVGIYLDIKLEKVITKENTNPEKTQVATTNSKITITVTIPEQLRDGSNYMIIRVHDGKAETLDATYDDEKHTLTFKTDKFSTYAITYTPKNMPPAQSSSSSSSSTSTKLTIENGRIYEGVVAVSSNQWVIVDQSNKLVKKLKPQNFTQQYDGQYKVYYVGDDGKLVTSWKLINDTWYYFNQDYTAKMNGWLAHYDDWYYFKNYLMVTSEWVATDYGRWYYLSNDGKMVRSQLVDGCWINSHGIYWGIAATEEDKLKYQ